MIKFVSLRGRTIVRTWQSILIILICFFVFAGTSQAKDILQFDFPNGGWHKVESPDGVKSKKCYVPVNQTASDYREMLIFSERIIKHEGINAMVMLQKQLGKDFNNYRDIAPQYILKNENNAMVTWCSSLKNVCSVERIFKGNEGIVSAIYINKMPHYSQNMFGQWPNILAKVEVWNKQDKTANNLIELD